MTRFFNTLQSDRWSEHNTVSAIAKTLFWLGDFVVYFHKFVM